MAQQQAMEDLHATRTELLYHLILHSTLLATLAMNYRDELGTSATVPLAASALKLGHSLDGMPGSVQMIKSQNVMGVDVA